MPGGLEEVDGDDDDDEIEVDVGCGGGGAGSCRSCRSRAALPGFNGAVTPGMAAAFWRSEILSL